MNIFKTNKFKKGDKVTPVGNHELGVFEVLAYSSDGYCCYQKGFQGHSGNSSLGVKTFVGTEYEAQCYWFLESELEIVEVSKNYREMSPNDLIKVNIDGFECEIHLGDLIHIQALVANSTGCFGSKIYSLLKQIDEEGICDDAYSTIKVYDQQEKLMKDFFVIDAQKEADKANLKELISNKQNELKELQDKLNQLN